MTQFIDNVLNRITMYRFVLYYLIALIGITLSFSIAGLLPYGPFELVASAAVLITTCWITNIVFSKTFGAQTNVESVYISALILVLIIAPARSLHGVIFLVWAGVLTIASKYILAIHRKHIFNPVAIGIALTALVLKESANWWVGTAIMMPWVALGGILVVRKIRRADLVFSFCFTALATTLAISIFKGSDIITMAKEAVLYSPLWFFAFAMFSEPLTTPPTQHLQIIYGAIVGFLFAPQVHIGTIYFTPEYALVIGNIFSYIVSPKAKLLLTLKEKIPLGTDLYDFVFSGRHNMKFAPGQYMEWTLGHRTSDDRGNRRYFTIASSPSEKDIQIGVKMYQPASTFKQALNAMRVGDTIIASQLAGDFTLPTDAKTDANRPHVFIAGGIGITPFRSMIKYLMDTGEKRPITLFYSVRTVDEIAYKELFDRAKETCGINVIYVLTDATKIPPDWKGATGYVNADMIRKEVPNYREALFYISGPHTMITAFEETLEKMDIPNSRIKTDFFPGFA